MISRENPVQIEMGKELEMIIESTLSLKIRIETEGEEDNLAECAEISAAVDPKHNRLLEKLKKAVVGWLVQDEDGRAQAIDLNTHMSSYSIVDKFK